MSKSKPLNLSALKKLDAQKYNGKKQVNIHGYDILIDESFRPTKLSQVFAEYQDKVIIANQTEGLEVNKIDWLAFLYMLLVKHFTNVQIPDDLESQLVAYIALVDNEFIAPILEHFGESNMQKFNDMLQAVSANMESYAEEIARKANPEVS